VGQAASSTTFSKCVTHYDTFIPEGCKVSWALRGNCGLPLPVADAGNPQFPQPHDSRPQANAGPGIVIAARRSVPLPKSGGTQLPHKHFRPCVGRSENAYALRGRSCFPCTPSQDRLRRSRLQIESSALRACYQSASTV